VYANSAFIQLLNTENATIVGQSILDYVPTQTRIALTNAIEQMQNEECSHFRYDLNVVVNNEVAYFQIDLNVHERCGTTVKIIGTATDVTEKVQIANQSLNTKSMFDTLYNNIVDGIVIYDYNREKMTGCNDAAVKIFGYESKEALQEKNRFQFVPKTSPIFPGNNLQEGTNQHAIRIRNKEAFRTPGIFVKANGEHMIVHASFVPTLRHEGEAFIIFQDSTQRILNKKKQKATEKKYRKIFQNSHEAIIYTSVQTKASFALILHFENPHYINIKRIFKAQNETKICWFKNRSLFNSRSIEFLLPL
jgi:PAS domain-containing protein